MPFNLTLSKSDFKLASTCAKKLQYKKQYLRSSAEENDFLESLAKGGFVVNKLATILHPGIEITGSTEEALAQTKFFLQQDKITLHEAAIEAGQKLVRIDILKKDGDRFMLIEVKSKSFTSENDMNEADKSLHAYKEEVAYQKIVLQEAYPQANIDSYLLLADKSKQARSEGISSWFRVNVDKPENSFRKITVEFVEEEGTPEYDEKRNRLLQEEWLQMLPLKNEISKMEFTINQRAEKFLKLLNNGFLYNSEDYKLNKECKNCEYKSEPLKESGYGLCWGDIAGVTPNVFDLYKAGSMGANKYLDELIDARTVSFNDIDVERLKTIKGEIGNQAKRQLMQIEQTALGKEWFSDTLISELKEWKYPLHFIDFETFTNAIPAHKNLHPYEIVAFQWSCHSVYEPGAKPIHTEWINTENEFPNFRFAESLMDQIGETGTPLMWSHHENTVLATVLRQMENFNYRNPELKFWLEGIVKNEKDSHKGRLLDMAAFTVRNYFHPYMKGSTSIKKVLPAIWNHHPFLHEIEWFKKYYKTDDHGRVMDPYLNLKYIFAENSPEMLMAENDIKEVVKGGGAAMQAYSDMMYGDIANKEILKKQLLEYCKLDTMAMVIIYTYWYSIK